MKQSIHKKNAIFVGVFFIILIVSYQYFHNVQIKYLSIKTFKECVDAGFSVQKSYPEKCSMPGKWFINPSQAKADNSPLETKSTLLTEYKNLSYLFDGQNIQFKDGFGLFPGNVSLRQSASSYEIVGSPFVYDVNNDTILDSTFLVRENKQKQSRSLFYVSSAVSLKDRYTGMNAAYVDYAVATSTFIFKNGEIVVRYTTESEKTTPKEKYFTIENGILKGLSH